MDYNALAREYMEIEFMEMIEQSGRTPSLLSSAHALIPAQGAVSERLSIPQGDVVLQVSRLIGADGMPAIYCEDYIPAALIKRKEYVEEDLQKPIFSFLKQFCALEPHMDLTEVRPAAADGRLAEIFRVAKGTPLLYLDELDYDKEGMPMLYSPQYYVGGVIQHTMLRMKF